MNKMQKIIEKRKNGEITEEEMDAEISKIHEEYIYGEENLIVNIKNKIHQSLE